MIAGYQPGSTINQDRFGNLVDKSATISERWINAGYAWRFGDGYKSLGLTGDKRFITFTTPAAGVCFYAFAQLSKSGDELVVSLNEGGTVANGTALTAYNLDRTVTSACTLTAIKGGLSTDGSPMSVTGGVDFPADMLNGSAAGASGAPGSSSAEHVYIKLKPSTTYTVVTEAKGAVTCTAFVDVAVII